MFTLKELRLSSVYALVCTIIAVLAFGLLYMGFEPVVGYAVDDTFTISQTITSEISFLTTANDVVMDASIPGTTGGSAYGTTTVVVSTNASAGYTMTIRASTSPAMEQNGGSGVINDYTAAVNGAPDYAWSVGANTGEFGYTVSASTTSDLAQKFLDNGSDTCNTGSADTGTTASCWYGLSTAATSTINRTSATPLSGSTSSVMFRTQITSNPAPAIPSGTYTATTTLTATASS